MRITNVAGLMVALATMNVAHADERASIADALSKLGTAAGAISTAAKSSDDRGARKKLAPAATELSDDLGALSRRAAKDVPLKSVSKDAAAIDTDATKLIEIVDEVEDKDERKALRAQAIALQQGVAAIRKTIDAAADKSDKPVASVKFTGQLLNNSNACSWEENLRFVVSQNGAQVFKSGLVFPGKAQALVVEKGQYLVQFTDTAGTQLGQATLDASKDGWVFKSGCVNQN